MQKISILGCGWLGLPLAKSLIQKGWAVNGSTTSAGKETILSEAGIYPFIIQLHPDSITGDVKTFLDESDALIIDIPPKLRGEQSESFVDKIRMLIPHIEAGSVTKVLFVSSTSVYGDDNLVVTEDTIPRPETESGKQLVECEQLLLQNPDFKTTVLRFGGLISEDRQPVKYIAGKDNLENPDGPVNVIYREDCIGIIEAILEKGAWGETFNGVMPYHPTRKEYYTQKALALGLATPKFNNEKPSRGKTVGADKVKTILGYTFKKGSGRDF